MHATAESMEKCKRETRRTMKPLVEKRRRARINQSLVQLKNLLEEVVKAEVSKELVQAPRQARLEKADILELTVRHLQKLQRHQRTVSLLSDPCLTNKFVLGFEECRREVERFLGTIGNFKPDLKENLVHHLSRHAVDITNTGPPRKGKPSPRGSSKHCIVFLHDPNDHSFYSDRCQKLTSPPPVEGRESPAEATTPSVVAGLTLYPCRLPSGDVVLLFPRPLTPTAVTGEPQSTVKSRNSTISSVPLPADEQSGHVQNAVSSDAADYLNTLDNLSSNSNSGLSEGSSRIGLHFPLGTPASMWRPW